MEEKKDILLEDKFVRYLNNSGLLTSNFNFLEYKKWENNYDELVFFLQDYFSKMSPIDLYLISKNIINNFLKNKKD